MIIIATSDNMTVENREETFCYAISITAIKASPFTEEPGSG